MLLNDQNLVKLLKDRAELVKKGRNISRKIETLEKTMKELDQERNKLGMQIGQLHDKIAPIIREKVEPQLKEFEEIGQLELYKGVVKVEIVDKVAQFKEIYLKRKKELSKKSDKK